MMATCSCQQCHNSGILKKNFLFYIAVQLNNNIVLVPGVQQSDSVIHIHASILYAAQSFKDLWFFLPWQPQKVKDEKSGGLCKEVLGQFVSHIYDPDLYSIDQNSLICLKLIPHELGKCSLPVNPFIN